MPKINVKVRRPSFHNRRRKQVDPGYVVGVQKEIVDSQKRTLSVLSETELVGANIAIALKEQGETLARTKQFTHNIGMNLKRSDRDIRAIKSWLGALLNKIIKPTSCGGFSQQNRDKNESERNQQRMEDYAEEIQKAYAHADISQEVIQNSKYRHTSGRTAINSVGNSQSSIDRKEDEISNNMNHIASSLNRLRTMSLEMGRELGLHNEMIGELDVDIKRQDKRTEGITRVLRSYDFY